MRKPRHTKEVHRALFLALQADAKGFPGGIRALAEAMGMNGSTLSNGLNPDHEQQPPSLAVVLDVIVMAQARRTMFALCRLTNQAPMDFELEHRSTGEAIRLFLDLVRVCSEMLGRGAEAAKDGCFDAQERLLLEPLLMATMKAAGELLQSLRG